MGKDKSGLSILFLLLYFYWDTVLFILSGMHNSTSQWWHLKGYHVQLFDCSRISLFPETFIKTQVIYMAASASEDSVYIAAIQIHVCAFIHSSRAGLRLCGVLGHMGPMPKFVGGPNPSLYPLNTARGSE